MLILVVSTNEIDIDQLIAIILKAYFVLMFLFNFTCCARSFVHLRDHQSCSQNLEPSATAYHDSLCGCALLPQDRTCTSLLPLIDGESQARSFIDAGSKLSANLGR